MLVCDMMVASSRTEAKASVLFRFGEESKITSDWDFYRSRAWKRMRAAILRRDGYLCQHCRRYGRDREATTVHHIAHLEDAPERALDPSNLISLCTACHNRAHPEKGGVRE